MNKKNALLLPAGLYDLLPPDARKESHAVATLLSSFESFGYAQVSPPLLEFETTLLSGRGEALSSQTFRVMDTLSQAMMGFRTDITMQIARIASSRLANSPRPLRLCYAGPILQSKAEPLKNERQLMQAGIELIGADSIQADAEVMIVAAIALNALNIKEISIDINLPGLLGELCPEAQNNPALRSQIKDAITRKDTDGIAKLPIAKSAVLAALVTAAGPIDKTIEKMLELGISQASALHEVAIRVKRHCPAVVLTLDPVEYRGFDYHQGISFSIFAKGLRYELGRGGRYQVNGDSATGFTLYVTHLLRLLPNLPEKKAILVAEDTEMEIVTKLRADGWITLYAMTDNYHKEAKHLGCSHIMDKGKIENL